MPVGVGSSLFLIAAGAILRYAVTADVSGVELATVGTILMVVGIVGLLITLLYPLLVDRGGDGGARRPPDEAPTRRL